MIDRLVPLDYFKKEPFYGSYHGMRYRVTKEEDKLHVVTYPEPYGFDATPEEKKESKDFTFHDEGREAAVAWLEEQYNTKKDMWIRSPGW